MNNILSLGTYQVKMNLIEDWDNHLNSRMLKMGYKPRVGGYKSLDYHKAMKKLISIKPRKVYYSKEFICPDESRNALNRLILDIEKGKNLMPYMSKKVINPSENDGLLNDWGIHHFHLNEAFDRDSLNLIYGLI